MTPTPTPEQYREVRAATRERRTHAKIITWRLRAMNPTRTTEERAACNAQANRLSAILRGS